MNIVICTDNRYAMPAGVMIYSLCKNNAPLSIYLIVPEEFSQKNRMRLQKVVDEFESTITFITINENVLDRFPVGKTDQPEHISVAAYFRLFMAELLPKNLEKVIYLDCDIVCMASLKPFWDIDVTGKPLACIKDIPYTGISEAVRLGYDSELGYFNSGVLLVNLKYWRENKVLESFLDCLNKNFNLIRYHDQDVLNMVFKGQVKFVEPKFNAQDRLFHLDTPCFPYPEAEVKEAQNSPVLVHFTYKNKPWILGGRHPYQRCFDENKKNSPWRFTILKPKKAKSVKGLLINILVLLRLYKYHDDYISI